MVGRRYLGRVPPFTDVVTTEAGLRELLPPAPPGRLSVAKEIDALDEHARTWIAASPLVLVASADADGRCDVSPRGGPAGWVRVLDERRLALPDAPGNRRADTLRNVIATGRCGLLFLVPGRRDVLRVNGRACVTTDPSTLAGIPGDPVLALGVEADEVFFHCAKALIRSQLWDAESWADPGSLAPLAETLRAHAARNGRVASKGEAEAQVEESLAQRMW